MACSTNQTSWLSPRLLTTTTNCLGFKVFKSSTKLCCCININIGSADHHDGSSTTPSLSVSIDCSSNDQGIKRRWMKADTHLHSPLLSQERFTVASYNILGDKNAAKHKDLYPNVPSFYLNWNRRRRVVCEELIGWNPDIICLQEVDKYYDLSSTMEKAGYLGSFKRRTGDIVDGCAMFWKADKFRLVGGENIEFKQYDLRDNVAQLSVFEMCRDETRRIVVGNVHVLFRPSRGEIKIGQIRLLSSKAHNLSEKWGNAPVVLAGDYNSTPQSEIYKFLSSSELNLTMHNRRELSGQSNCHPADVFGVKREKTGFLNLVDRLSKPCWTDKELKIATGKTDSNIAVHPLKLTSSYPKVKGSTETRDSIGEPLATSYHSKFFGTVDYLWYTNGLEPTRVLDTVPIHILHKTRGLPCNKVGSDHLALVSEFAFTENSTKKKTSQQ